MDPSWLDHSHTAHLHTYPQWSGALLLLSSLFLLLTRKPLVSWFVNFRTARLDRLSGSPASAGRQGTLLNIIAWLLILENAGVGIAALLGLKIHSIY